MIDGWNKGDWVVCVHHRFSNYTKGKKYQLVSDRNGSILEIVNDYDDIGYPSVYGFECGELIIYFNTIENIREEKINSILK